MDFGLSEEEERLVETIDRLVARHLPPDAQRRRDADHDPPYDLLPVLGDAGLLRLPFPEAAGGLGAPWTTVSVAQEALGRRAWMLGSLMNRAIGFGGMSLMTFASPAHREELLPRLMAGRLLFALALTEDDAGSDASAVRLLATRTRGGWRLDGAKTWISDAERADFVVTVARTDPASRRAAGLSLFLVPRGAAGVRLTEIPKIGNNCLPTFEIRFEGCELPDEALFGREGEGFAHLGETLRYARAGMASAVTGYAQFAVDLAVAHARRRIQFGRPIGSFQSLAHRLADMQIRVDQSRLMARDLAWRIAAGRPWAQQAAQAKVTATETLQFVAQEGMQILASAGYHAEADMARIWRDARLYSFGEGSNEIQRDIVARELGLGRALRRSPGSRL